MAPIAPRLVATTMLAAPLALGSASAARAQDDADQIERGRYVATAAGCVSCHTHEGNQPFAGGRPLPTEFGTIAVPNITPHETGIASYTLADFGRALRLGIRNDGAPLYPAMPYVHFTKMTDADLEALWAFMQTIEPVENTVEESALPFPYNVRTAINGWQAAFFEPGRFEPDPDRDETFNRGAYLVEALAHCSVCHTPRNALGAEIDEHYLKGAELMPWYAPNISNDALSVVGDYSIESLASFLGTGHDGANRTPYGRMAETVYDSTSLLPEEDVLAIATYIKTRDATPALPVEQPIELPEEVRERGEGLYVSNCASCHGDDGEGAEGVGARLANNGSVETGPANNVISVLLQGMPPREQWGVMPSFAEELSNEEIADIANYVRTAWGNTATRLATPLDVEELRRWIDPAAATVERAAYCPAVPADRMDPETRAALAALGTDAAPSIDAVRPIVEEHAERYGDLSMSQRITALTGAYCRALAEAAAAGDDRLDIQLDFMDHVGTIVADMGAEAN